MNDRGRLCGHVHGHRRRERGSPRGPRGRQAQRAASGLSSKLAGCDSPRSLQRSCGGGRLVPDRRCSPRHAEATVLIRRWILRLTLGPLLLLIAHMLTFRQVPVPLTPLMIIRMIEGEGLVLRVGSTRGNESPPRPLGHRQRRQSLLHPRGRRLVRGEGRPRGSVIGRARTGREHHQHADGQEPLPVAQSIRHRKGLEVGIVQLLEATWSKERIIEVYLNIVELGPGVYGVEAAAQHHWGVTAASLGPDRAAALAAMLPAPRTRTPQSSEVRGSIKRIQRRVRELGEYLDCVPPAPAVPVEPKTTRPTSVARDSSSVPLGARRCRS